MLPWSLADSPTPPVCMVQVVLARHRTSGEYAALKVVFLESPAVASDPEHLATLQR